MGPAYIKKGSTFIMTVFDDISVFEKLNKLVFEKKLSSIEYVFHNVPGTTQHYHILMCFRKLYTLDEVQALLLHDVDFVMDPQAYSRYLREKDVPTRIEF